jgi:hypothetical protein
LPQESTLKQIIKLQVQGGILLRNWLEGRSGCRDEKHDESFQRGLRKRRTRSSAARSTFAARGTGMELFDEAGHVHIVRSSLWPLAVHQLVTVMIHLRIASWTDHPSFSFSHGGIFLVSV